MGAGARLPVVRECAAVARSGQLAVLKWALEQHCAWDEMTCVAAATGGQLEALKLAREHHCPWDEDTCTQPLGTGSWRC